MVDNDVAVLSDWAFRTIPGCRAAIAHECRLFFFKRFVGVQLALVEWGVEWSCSRSYAPNLIAESI